MEFVSVTRNGLVITVFVSAGQSEEAVHVKRMGTKEVNFFTLKERVPLRGVLTWVGVNMKVDQLKGKILCVCDARCLVQRRQGGVNGETRVAVCHFDFESLPNKRMLGCISLVQAFVTNTLRCYRFKLMGMWQQCVGWRFIGVRIVQKGMRQRNVLIVGVPVGLGIRNVWCE